MLPQELTDKVIDCLYDDKPSLGQCSLVCWAWVPATRFHIFADITLRRRWNRIMHTQFRLFLDMLAADSCTFASFVAHLTLEDLDPTPEAGQEFTPAFSALPKLTSVVSLTFKRWQNLGVQPIHNLLPSLPALSEVALIKVTVASVGQLFGMLEMCPSLTSLAIDSVSWGSSSSPIVVYSHAGSIRKLRLASFPMAEFLSIFAPPNACSKLTCDTVEIRGIDSENATNIANFLNHMAKSLQHLVIGFTNVYPDEQSRGLQAQKSLCTRLDLQKHTRLVSLLVENVDVPHSESSSTMLSVIKCALSSPNLEELAFSMPFWSENQLSWLRWDQIDDILSSPQLNSLRVTFRINGWKSWDMGTFSTLLPRSLARDIVVFTNL